MTRRELLSVLPLMASARRLRSQEQSKPSFSADVKVVNLFATVRDKQGKIVSDLTKDDFLLDEDGRPQVIRYFSRESDLPLTIGLLVDTSGSQVRVLDDERSASYTFLQQVLREKDLAFVIHFDFEVELLQDLTNSRERLEKALDELQAPQLQRRRHGGGGGYPRGPRRRGGGTDLYDSVLLASDELMRKQSGRKALMVLSDGVDTGSKVSLERAVESAQRADTLVYGILFADPSAYGNMGGFGPRRGRHGGWGGPRYPMPGRDLPDGKKVLQRISRETGGRFFEVSRKMPIAKVYSEIQEDLRNQYSIGYTPDKTADAAAYRRIHLTTKRKNLIVHTREGYYAG